MCSLSVFQNFAGLWSKTRRLFQFLFDCRFHFIPFDGTDDRVFHHAYGACFFRNDQDETVIVFGDTNGGTVTKSIMAGNVGLVGYGQNATCRSDPIVADNHGTVVKWAVLKEDILNQCIADVGIDIDSCQGYVVESVLFGDDNQGTLLDVRHVLAGLRDGIHIENDIAVDFYQMEFSCEFTFPCLCADGEQKPSKFWLENDDKRNEANAYESA